MKIQLTCFDISGKVYKQSIHVDLKRAYQAHRRNNQKYGGGLRFETMEVPDTQKRPIPVANKESAYCFCPNTPLYVSKCPSCGKRPYTD